MRAKTRACLIVAGSAGTGEMTIGSDGSIVSDVEIAVVGWLPALLAARRIRRVTPEIETYWVAPWRLRLGLRRNLGTPRPTVSAYDLARQPRYGELPRSAGQPRLWQATDLGDREALSLLGNRVGEALEVRTGYSLTKLAVACGDALLIAAGSYTLGYAERARLFAASTWPISTDSRAVVCAGYRAKLKSAEPGLRLDDVSVAVAETITAIVGPDPFNVGDWSTSYTALSGVWANDLADVKLTSKLVDLTSTAVRAYQGLGRTRARTLLKAFRQPQPAVYAALLRMLDAWRGAGSSDFPLPEDVPTQLGTTTYEVLRAWKAVR